MLILQAKENTICVWKALAKKNRKKKERITCSVMERLTLIIMLAFPVPAGLGWVSDLWVDMAVT